MLAAGSDVKLKYMIEVAGPSSSGMTDIFTLSGERIGCVQPASELRMFSMGKWIASITAGDKNRYCATGIGNTPDKAISDAIATSIKTIHGLTETLNVLGVDISQTQEIGNESS